MEAGRDRVWRTRFIVHVGWEVAMPTIIEHLIVYGTVIAAGIGTVYVVLSGALVLVFWPTRNI